MTSADLYDTYLRVMNEDQLDIYVTGNVTESETRKLLEKFDFSPRKAVKWDPFHYRNKTGTIRKKKETQKINQTILTMAFWTPIYYQNEYYFTGLVFDGIFGSMPHSGLFMTIRENENLAYAISSDVDAYRGMLTVEAGIESKDVRKVTDLVRKELKKIIEGAFTEEDILQTKEILKSEICQFADSPYSMIEKDYSM
ncbi:MAG: insulinase family protein [Alkalibacterium sp.]|nr:insulinase family protein [Alkalibacterium sp.]